MPSDDVVVLIRRLGLLESSLRTLPATGMTAVEVRTNLQSVGISERARNEPGDSRRANPRVLCAVEVGRNGGQDRSQTGHINSGYATQRGQL